MSPPTYRLLTTRGYENEYVTQIDITRGWKKVLFFGKVFK